MKKLNTIAVVLALTFVATSGQAYRLRETQGNQVKRVGTSPVVFWVRAEGSPHFDPVSPP